MLFRLKTIEEVIQYVEHHPVGTQANLAFSLMLFLGARRGDAARLGPKNMKDGVMTYVPRKTKYKRLEPSIKPILPPLLEAIRRTPIGLQSLLVNQLRQAVHARWIGRVVQRGRTARVFLARPQEGCRHDLRQHGGDRSTAHGAVREAGERLHAERRSSQLIALGCSVSFFGVAADTARTG